VGVRHLHFDCFSGLSGDMTLAALIDLGVDPELIRTGLALLHLPIQVEIERVKRNGISALRVEIVAPEEEEHRYLHDVERIIDSGQLTESQKRLAKQIFHRLAVAEASVHGIDIQKVHFHEVGALDSIADIVGCAIALDSLGIQRFSSRSVPPGAGTVKCAHGIMPIPAPATAKLLEGVPLASAAVKGELVTPTGAAILTTLVTEYTDQPQMTIQKIGCGAGKRDPWEQPNILRLFLGESTSSLIPSQTDTIWLLETNLDDCPGEIIGYTLERVLASGAVDAFTVPIQMKKFRPGVLLSVLAPTESVTKLEQILFQETGTFGIRKQAMTRVILQRESITIPTSWGDLPAKRGWNAAGHEIITPEYEACARIAREKGVPLRVIYSAVGNR
jgi:uncharacterized protein (TIGR00299 family) protein